MACRWAMPEMISAPAAIEREHADEPDANAAFGADALVDALLEQDRHHDAARRPDGGEQPGDPEPLAQDRRLLEPAADRPDRGEPPERLGHSPPPPPPAPTIDVASSRSASNASTSSR